MLKSTSRQILEVTRTDHPYFERVLFVVRHDCTDHPPHTLNTAAQRVLDEQTAYSGIRRSRYRERLRQLFSFALGGVLGAVAAVLLSLLM